jgi:CRP-like cAMP-binding protein
MLDAGKRQTAGRAADKLTLLRNHALFRELPAPVIETIGAYMKRRSVTRGSTIFSKGDPGTGLMGVLSGSVKISVTSPEGRDIVLNIIHPGEIFGEIALLDGHPRTADAMALSDCEFMIIERREFIPFLLNQPAVAIKLMEILCSRLRHTSEQVHDVTFLNLSVRLARTLSHLAVEDTSTSGGEVAITQREIGAMVGRSRESTNKQLSAWAKRGWIRLHRGGVTILKPEKLAEIATEGSDFDRS